MAIRSGEVEHTSILKGQTGKTVFEAVDGSSDRADDATPAKRIIDWHGFKLGLQYQPFDIRHGKVLPVAYGHIQKTRGADGMACDCYVGADLESDRVFEVTQLVNGQSDEHKYMLGFDSLDAARDTFLKVMPEAMFGGIREVGLAGLAAYRTDGGSEGTNPKASSGGTSHIDADNPILSSIDRADKLLQGLEDGAIERVNSALESSYQALEAQILRSYSLETPGSLMGRERAAVLLSQVADLLGLINTRNAEEIQEAFEDLLQGADAQGTTLAADLARAIANQQLQTTANVPVAAIVNQATEGMTRLRNHTEAFADKASTIVGQGLIQGWGTDKVASLLQKEMGLVRHKAETIARTESISALDASTRATYQQNGIIYVLRIGTQDTRICPICVDRVGKAYPIANAPAVLHPRDRCYNAPFKFEWLELGLIDTEWLQKSKQGAISELAKQGLEPDPGIAPFEKANGLSAPTPVWELGQKFDSEEQPRDEKGRFAAVGGAAKAAVGTGVAAAAGHFIGGAIAGFAAQHGVHPEVAHIISEVGVKALTATAIFVQGGDRSPKEIAAKFILEASAGTVGKLTGTHFNDLLSGVGGDAHIKAIVDTVNQHLGTSLGSQSGITVAKLGTTIGSGIGTSTTLSKSGLADRIAESLATQGQQIKALLDRGVADQLRSDSASGDLSEIEARALFDLTIAGLLLGLDRQEAA